MILKEILEVITGDVKISHIHYDDECKLTFKQELFTGNHLIAKYTLDDETLNLEVLNVYNEYDTPYMIQINVFIPFRKQYDMKVVK